MIGFFCIFINRFFVGIGIVILYKFKLVIDEKEFKVLIILYYIYLINKKWYRILINYLILYINNN